MPTIGTITYNEYCKQVSAIYKHGGFQSKQDIINKNITCICGKYFSSKGGLKNHIKTCVYNM